MPIGEKIRNHEKIESRLNNAGIEDKDYAQAYENLSTAEQQEVIAHLQVRMDFSSLSQADKMREFTCDYQAGRVKKDMAGLAKAFEEAIRAINRNTQVANAKTTALQNMKIGTRGHVA